MNNYSTFRAITSSKMVHNTKWYQGRGVYGGLIFAQIAHSIKQHSDFPLRRLSIDLCAPLLEGENEITVSATRKNANSQFFYVTLLQNEKVIAHGTAVCGGKRSQDVIVHQQKAPEDTPPSYPALAKNPLMPAFTQFFEYWPTIGSLPFSGAEDIRTGGWIRCRDDRTIDDEMILGLIDAWWPCLVLSVRKPRPMGTVSFSVDIANTESFHQDEPCLIESRCKEISDGYAIETNHLWSAKGVLLAKAQQNVVLI